MTVDELTKKFVIAEKAGDLFSFRSNGIPVWWFMRERVYYAILKESSKVDVTANNADALSLRKAVDKAVEAIHINNMCQHRILGLSTSSLRREKVEGRDFDIFLDFLAFTSFKNEYAVLETPDQKPHSVRPYSKHRYYGDYLVLKGNIHRRIAQIFPMTDDSMIEYSKRVHKFLQDTGIEFAWEKLRIVMAREAAYAVAAINVANKYIQQIAPQLLIVECSYTSSHMAIQYAAKKKGVPVLELQHGLLGESGIEYNFGLCDSNQLQDTPFPDAIAVFGNHFKKVLLKNPNIKSEQVAVVGFPYLWKKRQEFLRNQLTVAGRILITSQPGFTEQYILLAQDLAGKVDNEILFKLHPAESPKYNECKNALKSASNVRVLDVGTQMYEALAGVEYHVSSGSTTQIEALALGIKIVIVAMAGFERFYQFLINMGVPLVTDINGLQAVLDNYPSIDHVFPYVQHDIFALEHNPVKALEELIREKLEIS